MPMKDKILERLREVAVEFKLDFKSVKLEYPENPEHGDFSTNMAMVHAKESQMSPKALAEKIITEFKKRSPEYVRDVTIAGPGFINFFIEDEYFAKEIIEASKNSEFGIQTRDPSRKVMVEYTDPNPFKVFHIGHLMANAIGESIARLVEYSGAKVVRANWQGDVGPHVAKAVYGALESQKSKVKSQKSNTKETEHGTQNAERPEEFWGRAYVIGAEAYENDPEAKKEIEAINKKIYDRSDPTITALYDKGRAESLEAFEQIYKRLGTKFDEYFFESLEGRVGQGIVEEYLAQGIFERSEGAVVWKGESAGLHTRVFINSQGLPTYEAKELGLNREKFELHPDLTQSIIVTANEQNDYFRVVLKVMELIFPEIARRTKHISHGLLRFATGKMASRKGNVISAEQLISDIRKLVEVKIADRGFKPGEAEEIADIIAIGAIKYTILRSSIGSDIIFDSSASISFEGDSGPYLQYAVVRAKSVIKRAEEEEIIGPASASESLSSAAGPQRSSKSDSSAEAGIGLSFPEKVTLLEKLLTRFPDILARAAQECAPQIVANYLIALAGAFNSFYASQVIIDEKDPLSPYYVALTQAFKTVMTNGLWVLGIKVPGRM